MDTHIHNGHTQQLYQQCDEIFVMLQVRVTPVLSQIVFDGTMTEYDTIRNHTHTHTCARARINI